MCCGLVFQISPISFTLIFFLKKRCCMLLLRIFCHYLLLIRARDGNNSCMRPSLAGFCKMSALYTHSCIIRFDKPFAIYRHNCTESHAQIWHFRIYLHIHNWHKKSSTIKSLELLVWTLRRSMTVMYKPRVLGLTRLVILIKNFWMIIRMVPFTKIAILDISDFRRY